MSRKRGLSFISISVIIILVVALGVFFSIDRKKPNIYVQNKTNQKDVFWNLKIPIKVDVIDKNKIKLHSTA